jgi:thiol-disulfide isomerase/thioredoxin
MCSRCTFSQVLRFVLLAFFLCSSSEVSSGQSVIDPAALLQNVSQKYMEAKYYHIEAQLSEKWNGKHSSRWEESFRTAIVSASGRYRFQADGPRYSWVQASNGAKEWVYNATTKEYIEKQATDNGRPSQFDKDGWSAEEFALIEAQNIPKALADMISSVRTPVFAGSEILLLGSERVACYLIRAQGRYKSGWSPDTHVNLTFWIDKSALIVRKIREDWQGQLIMGDAARYTRTVSTVYRVADLTDRHAPSSLFEFDAPSTAKLVTKFAPMRLPPTPHLPDLVGSMAPQVSFQAIDGHTVLLASFRGKPVLLEFWATWCAPCVAAMPRLERLYASAQEHGIVVITVDEDDTAEKAASFLSDHENVTWQNYHDDGEINRALPGEGFPEFVLVDAAEKITLERSGFDEHELRTSLAHLGFDIGNP